MVRLAPCGCMRQPPPLQLRGGMGWSKPEMIPKPSSAPRPVPGIMRHRPSKQEMAAGALTGGGGAGGGGRCNETSNGVRANTEAPSTLSARPSISTSNGEADQDAERRVKVKAIEGLPAMTWFCSAGWLLAVGHPFARIHATRSAPPASAAMKARAWLSWLADMRSCMVPALMDATVAKDATASKISPMASAAPRWLRRPDVMWFLKKYSFARLFVVLNSYPEPRTASWR